MKCNAQYVTTILFVLLCVGLCFCPAAAAQWYPPDHSGVFKTYEANESVPSGIVEGRVVDAWGHPIPNATVTLWKYGEVWPQSPARWDNSTNPQYTPVYQYGSSREMGWYSFGFVEPGIYEVTAEKGSYKQSRSIYLGDRSLHRSVDGVLIPSVEVDFTFYDYTVPGYANVDTLNWGAITGLINDSEGLVQGLNVSLWQGGKLVDTINNPQLSSVILIPEQGGNYFFEHLPPGQYRVVIETTGEFGEPYRAYKAVYVDNDTQVASFEMPFNVTSDQATPVPSIQPAPTATPMPPAATEVSPAAIPSDMPVATPATISELISIAGVLGATFILCMRKRL